jgi:hypothetical protein
MLINHRRHHAVRAPRRTSPPIRTIARQKPGRDNSGWALTAHTPGVYLLGNVQYHPDGGKKTTVLRFHDRTTALIAYGKAVAVSERRIPGAVTGYVSKDTTRD